MSLSNNIRIPNVQRGRNGTMTLGVRTLRSLCIDVILVSSKGKKFLSGCHGDYALGVNHSGLKFMYAAGMTPEKLSVMMVNDHKFHLQFWIPGVDMHPFTVIFKSLHTLLNGIGHLNVWKTPILEIMNCTFTADHLRLMQAALSSLCPQTLMLMNCAYTLTHEQKIEFQNACNNKGATRVYVIGHSYPEERFAPAQKFDNMALDIFVEAPHHDLKYPPVDEALWTPENFEGILYEKEELETNRTACLEKFLAVYRGRPWPFDGNGPSTSGPPVKRVKFADEQQRPTVWSSKVVSLGEYREYLQKKLAARRVPSRVTDMTWNALWAAAQASQPQFPPETQEEARKRRRLQNKRQPGLIQSIPTLTRPLTRSRTVHMRNGGTRPPPMLLPPSGQL